MSTLQGDTERSSASDRLWAQILLLMSPGVHEQWVCSYEVESVAVMLCSNLSLNNSIAKIMKDKDALFCFSVEVGSHVHWTR